MGMKLARPDDNVVCLQGDLDFSYRAMDIDTCARYDLPVVSIIANDSTMGYIKREQEALYGPNRSYATDLEFRNFENVCEALGGHGELVRETSEIRPALERSFASGKPAVINVVIQRVPSPGLNWFYRDIDPRDGRWGVADSFGPPTPSTAPSLFRLQLRRRCHALGRFVWLVPRRHAASNRPGA